MRIAWLTPWTQKSAIGQFSALVVAELRRLGADVDIWYPPAAGGRAVPDRGRSLGPSACDELRGYDAVVYNMGNNRANHARIHGLSVELPGTVILHDVVLTHLFLPGVLQQVPSAAAQMLGEWYGPEGAEQVAAMREHPQAWLTEPGNIERFPLLQPALAGATQVITHSAHAARLVQELFVGDVHELALPALSGSEPSRPGLELDWLDHRPLVLQAGAVNANKCVPTILDAFADLDLAEHFQLVIAGHLETADRKALERRVVAAGLGGTVHLLGTVNDDTMIALRERASIATVLRSPVTEASSAVLIDSLSHGLATIALETGHYREHPADVVQFLPARPSSHALGKLLMTWAHEPQLVEQRSRAALEYVARRHSPQVYAQNLLSVLPFRAAERRRRSLARETAQLVKRNGYGLDGPLAQRVAEEAAALFGRAPRRGRPGVKPPLHARAGMSRRPDADASPEGGPR